MRKSIFAIVIQELKGIMILVFALGIVVVSVNFTFSDEQKMKERNISPDSEKGSSHDLLVSKIEGRCIASLKSLGSTQLAYADNNDRKDYGTWFSLVQNGYIPKSQTRGNFIEDYSLSLFSVRLSGRKPDGSSAFDSSFTIVASPMTRTYSLHSLAIGHDQTVRKWLSNESHLRGFIFNNNVNLNDPELWEPIR